jgi:hypothetical protein
MSTLRHETHRQSKAELAKMHNIHADLIASNARLATIQQQMNQQLTVLNNE